MHPLLVNTVIYIKTAIKHFLQCMLYFLLSDFGKKNFLLAETNILIQSDLRKLSIDLQEMQ